jgi:hypothetical protein
MTSGLTINQWIVLAHLNAVERGWWGNPVDVSTESVLAKLMLVASELSEAVELVREPGFDPKMVWYVDGARAKNFIRVISSDKPEGFGVEIADAAIRIFDLLGGLRFDAPAGKKLNPVDKVVHDLSADAVLAALMRTNALLGKAADVAETPPHLWKEADRAKFLENMLCAVEYLVGICGWLGVDLEARVAEKHEYNKTRPMRHGGKRA